MIPDIEITENGIVAPTTDEVLAGVWEILKTAFGSNLNTAMNTPQGQLATSLTAIIQNERNKWIQLMNQFDPQYSTGIWQDAIGELYFLDKKMATSSVVSLEFSGLVGVTIPQGFIVQSVSGTQWQTSGAVVIQSTGITTVEATCVQSGEIGAQANTITIIPISLSGLDRVTNPSPATVGFSEENRLNFEIRRQESVAINSKMTDAATRGAVASLNNVVDVFVISNPTDNTVNIGKTNYPLVRNSILVSVVGGTDYDIAWQTLVKAGTGCSFNGDTEVTVFDTDTYPQSPPRYNVKFLRPESTTIYWRVTLVDISKMSYEAEIAIKKSILDGMATGSTRARIGGVLRASAYVCAVSAAAPSIGLEIIEVSLDGSTWSNVINVGVDQFPVSTEMNISIVEG